MKIFLGLIFAILIPSALNVYREFVFVKMWKLLVLPYGYQYPFKTGFVASVLFFMVFFEAVFKSYAGHKSKGMEEVMKGLLTNVLVLAMVLASSYVYVNLIK